MTRFAPVVKVDVVVTCLATSLPPEVVPMLSVTEPTAPTQLLSPRNYLNNGTTAASAAYDCSGVYVETDF